MARFENPVKNFFREIDWVTFVLSLVTSVYGVLLVYSATYRYLDEGQWISRTALVMIISIALGVLLALAISYVDYDIITKLWPFIALGCVVLMIVTYIFADPPAQRPDARSWLKIFGISFQSSEVVKIGFIITFSYHLDMVKTKINKIKNVVFLGIHAMVYIGLMFFTGDAGTGLIFMAIALVMLFCANLSGWYFLAGGAAVVAAFPLMWAKGIVFDDIQKDRVLAVLYPDKYTQNTAYQANQGVAAVGSGRIFGKGYLKGNLTQNGLVPESQNDMIISVAGEEFGLIGAFLVILLLCALMLRIYRNGLKSRDNVGYLMCCGVCGMLLAQTAVNVAMALRLFPVVGITLPFFSSGGSSNLSVYLAIGLVLSIYRFSKVPNDMLFYGKRG